MIAIEGTEGAGKSTALGAIEAYLTKHEIPYICVREPGGTEVGEKLRDILKSPCEETLKAETELLLMYASRTQLYHTKIKPSLEQGIWVIADRFELSSYAYQGYGRQISLGYLEGLSALCINNFKPDLILYLDIPYEVSQLRVQQRGIAKDRIESEAADFFERVRMGYLNMAELDEKISVIDATQTQADVEKNVIYQMDYLCN